MTCNVVTFDVLARCRRRAARVSADRVLHNYHYRSAAGNDSLILSESVQSFCRSI